MENTHEEPPAYDTICVPTQPPENLNSNENSNGNSNENSNTNPDEKSHDLPKETSTENSHQVNSNETSNDKPPETVDNKPHEQQQQVQEHPHEYAHEDHLRVRLGHFRGRSKEKSRDRSASGSPNRNTNRTPTPASRESSISHPLLSSREASQSRENSRSRSRNKHDEEGPGRIKIHDECTQYQLSLLTKKGEKRKVGYIIFRHDEHAPGRVIVGRVGRNGASREEFLDNLPDNMCRHATVRFEYELEDGRVKERVGFVAWVPETAAEAQKELFATSQPILKGYMQGVDCMVKTGDKEKIFEELVGRAKAKRTWKKVQTQIKQKAPKRERSEVEILVT
ncbi:Cofilin [Arthrobotrys entomopaga]|nr:Cofilin [Arthrobotrys entomopaga]